MQLLIFVWGIFYYSQPHIPTFKGQENFNGQIIHPQFWSEEIDYTNKKNCCYW